MNAPEEGKKAPAFKGVDQNGNTVSLAQFKGKKIALYFYPQDMTPTCTVQACNLRNNYAVLEEKGISIVGVSPDDAERHRKFEAKHQLPFPLLADTTHVIINRYHVWGQKQLYGRKYMGLYRTTFLINEKGIIVKIIRRPKSKQHAAEILTGFGF